MTLPNFALLSAKAIAGSSFSPDEVSGLKAWWDASDTATITNSAGECTQITDKSGNGWTLTPSSASERPATGSRTMNSMNVLDFDGTDELVTAGNFGLTTSTPLTVFAVVEMDTKDRYDAIFSQNEASTESCIAVTVGWNPGGSSGTPAKMMTDQWRPAGAAGSVTISTATPYVLAWRMSTISAHQTGTDFFVDGTLDASPTSYGTTNPSTLSNAVARVGGWGAGQFDGAIGEVIVYAADLSDTDMDSVNDYLTAKWGI